MALSQEQERIYTIEDLNNLSKGQRAELIDGRLYMLAAPSTTHQRILNYINNSIYNYIKLNKGDCEVFPAPFAVFLNQDDKTYLEPDISVICDHSKLDSKGCIGAPDWIIEITSSGTSSHDYLKKLNLYADYGVCEYWIVNPQKEIITVWNFNETDIFPQNYTFKDKIKANIYDDLVIDFNEINF